MQKNHLTGKKILFVCRETYSMPLWFLAEEIKAEVLAAELLQLDDEAIAQAETIKEWNINGHDCTLALRRFH